MEGLNLDNILDEEAIGLFNDNGIQEEETVAEEGEDTPEKENQEDTTEASSEGLFGGPESVGSESEDIEEKEDTFESESTSTSPKNDFFSSIAEAFAEEGILPNLDEDTIKNIRTPEDFREAIDNYIKSELTEQQNRIKEALDNNVPVDSIRQYENVLNYLGNISAEDLKAESNQGEELRKRLLYQDYINRGFDNARATKEVERAIKNGTDIEDASDALESCLNFYKKGYNKLLDDAKKEKLDYEKSRKERAETLKKNILDSRKKFFGDLDIDKNTRQKVFDNISKPIYKDPETGEYYTAVQKYELENSDEFLAKVGLLFTLTDGFKTLDKLVDSKAKKVIRKGFRELESKLNNTARDSYGNLKYTSGVDDSESYLGRGIKLAL